ncbi:MAG: LamG domain-containing protein, partial [Dehalococcoidia bacterium]
MKANTDCRKGTFLERSTPRLWFVTALILALALGLVLFFAHGATVTRGASTTTLTPLAVSQDTGEKPQSKVWQYNSAWWAVLPSTAVSPSGTWLWRLQPDNSWTNVLKLSDSTGADADVKPAGDVVHVLLHDGISDNNLELVSAQYVSAGNTYQLWPTRTTTTLISLPSYSETSTIDIDTTGRMWLATDNGSNIIVYYSDSPYSSFSGPITLANNVNDDDISDVIAMPGNKVGVLWSNQQTQRFGFKTHTDGADPNTWSADELPASQSALNVGAGMADDHLNMKVAADGTLYAAVKTSYDTAGYPKIALLVRRPNGTWDNLYGLDEAGTRGIVVLNEAAGTVRVIYTTSEGSGDIVYKESSLSSISFGAKQTLMTGGLNNATSTKQNWSSSLVVLAGNGSSANGVLITSDVTPTATPPPTATTDPCGAGGLVGYWAMEENGGTTLIDSTSPANNATIVGSPTWVAGKVGSYALSLSGSGQYATVADNSCLNPGTAITLSAWVKTTKATTTQYVIKKARTSGGTSGYELALASTGKAFFRVNNNATYRVDSTTSYAANAWIHLAATYDGTTIRIYINGVEEASKPGISIASNTTLVGIGAQDDGVSPFAGQLDEARIYKRALSSAEVMDLYHGVTPPTSTPTSTPVGTPTDTPVPSATPTSTVAPSPTPTPNCGVDGLVAHYMMDENGGTTLADSSPPSNDGTIYGSPTWVSGQNGLALNLNGSTQYALVPNDACLNITGPITLAAWVRPGQQGTQDLVKKATNASINGYELSLASASSTKKP